MAEVIIGRESELAALRDFMGRVQDGPVALLLEGEAGIGKTILWNEGVQEASARSYRVLTSRAAQSEAKLSFAGLADLLRGLHEEVFRHLADPQQRAVDVALLRRGLEGGVPDVRTIGTAVRSILGALAGSGAVVVAVDDVQWLDRPTSRVLEFALRRLEHLPVGVLVAARAPAGTVPPLGLDRAVAERRLIRLPIGPLNLEALHKVMSIRLERSLPRGTLLRVARASGGNPFFALEIARQLRRVGGGLAPGQAVPIPESLQELLTDRIASVPASTRRVLLVVASLSKPTVELVTSVRGSRARSELERGQEQGLIEIREGFISFAHPLLAAAVYSSATTRARRDIHRGLAAAVEDPEEGARHLALATIGPDERTARALEEAALLAYLRGAPDAGVELVGLAIRLTEPGRIEGLNRRKLFLGDLLLGAGEAERAREVLQGLSDESQPTSVRVAALRRLARVAYGTQGFGEGIRILREALLLSKDDLNVQAEFHATLSLIDDDDVTGKLEHAEAALASFRRLTDPDPWLWSHVAEAVMDAEFRAGRGVRMDLIEEALAAERSAVGPNYRARASLVLQIALGQVADAGLPAPTLSQERPVPAELTAEYGYAVALRFDDQLDRAAAQFDSMRRSAEEAGNDLLVTHLLWHLAAIEIRLGDWAQAETHAERQLELATEFDQRHERAFALQNLALLDALLGRAESGRSRAEEALRSAEEVGDLLTRAHSSWTLGFLELSLGNLPGADRHLVRAGELRDRIGVLEPSMLCYQPDHIEALVGLGKLEEAWALVEELEARSRRLDRRACLSSVLRGKALLLSARGDLEGAVDRIGEAIQFHEGALDPFDAARTTLVAGEIRRRRKEKRAAKDLLVAALRSFEGLGATLWAARARQELSRVGLRPPAPLELTATERQVAELAAKGMTTREVAAAVFMAPKSVEDVLSRVYRKLGIRSRAELGARMAGPPGS